MKKKLLIVMGLLLITFISIARIVIANKYPDNYIYEFGGYNKHHDSVVDMYVYNDQIYAVVKSGEITHEGWLDDSIYKYNLIISIIDSEDNIKETISFDEIEILDSSRMRVTSAQFENFLYFSVNTDDLNYFITYDCLTSSYEISEVEVYMNSFIVDDKKIFGYDILDTPDKSSGNYYHDYVVTYYEFSLDMEVQYEEEVISLINAEYLPGPVLSMKYLAITGVVTEDYSKCDYILYDVTTHSSSVTEDNSCDSSELIVISSEMYRVLYSYDSEDCINISIFDLEHNLINVFISDEEQMMFVDHNTGYVLIYGEYMSEYNKVKLQNIFTGDIIEKEYDVRTYLSGVYVFDNEIYLVLAFRETQLDILINGYNEYYIVHE